MSVENTFDADLLRVVYEYLIDLNVVASIHDEVQGPFMSVYHLHYKNFEIEVEDSIVNIRSVFCVSNSFDLAEPDSLEAIYKHVKLIPVRHSHLEEPWNNTSPYMG